jgi:TatA/E family protein of Tat protein translocase
MGSIGMGEMIVIFLIALIVFGPRKLPELARALGKGINEFKKASTDLRTTIEEEIRADEQRRTMESTAAAANAAEPVPQILPPPEPPPPALPESTQPRAARADEPAHDAGHGV